MMPDGRRKRINIELADDLSDRIFEICECDLDLECEVFRTDYVSFTITDSCLGDFDIELVPNGPEIPEAVDRLIRRFSKLKYEEWKKRLDTAPKLWYD